MEDEKVKGPAPPNMAWLLTFADLISLLVTFFVLLFSMKSVDESRWDLLRGSLDGVFAKEESTVVIHPDEFKTMDSISDFPADSLPYLQNVLKVEFKQDPVLSKIDSEYRSREDVLVLSLPSSILFKAGDIVLQRAGKIAMIKLADKLRHLDNRIQVAGYTDPGRLLNKDIPTNWELAMLRAIGVARIFYERGMQQHIPAISYGDSRFDVRDNNLPELEKYMKARRVDVMIYGGGDDA